MSNVITPFELRIEDNVLDDLTDRLKRARLPDKEPVNGWEQGLPIAHLIRLKDYWLTQYDWRRCESQLNRTGQFKTTIDGLDIHFLHIRSKESNARPLLITHGWPGSVIEFLKIIDPLTNPLAHGGTTEDAFDLVLPSIPGFGFSDHPITTGWGIDKVVSSWLELMTRLGYDRFLAQGGDWGAGITTKLAATAPERVAAIHLNLIFGGPLPSESDSLTDKEKAMLKDLEHHNLTGRGYSVLQSTKPQTLGYLLADSPTGQAAWIYEKFRNWSDCGDDPCNSFSMDELLDNIMLYWLSNSGASSARMYWENAHYDRRVLVEDVETGATLFPKEIFRCSRRFAERLYPKLNYWSEQSRGGHFAAFEVPELYVDEIRSCFRVIGRYL